MWICVEAGASRGLVVPVQGERYTIGTSDDAWLRLTEPAAAALQASLRPTSDGGLELHPEAPGSPVLLDGEPVEAPTGVQDGQRVAVGETVLALSRDDPTASPAERLDEPTGQRNPAGGPLSARARRAYAAQASERQARRMRRAVRRATVMGLIALCVAGGTVALALNGVLGGSAASPERARGPAAPAAAPTVADVVRGATPGTVLVRTKIGDESGSGSGWVLDAQRGLIVTNHHVVNAGESFQAGTADALRDARLLAAAPCSDLAILELTDRRGLRALPLGDQAGLEQGEQVVALGFPANISQADTLTTTAGIVSVVRDSFRAAAPDIPEFDNLIRTDAALNPGNSGGPLLDLEGRVVGVNTAVVSELGGRPIQGQGYAIGVDTTRQVLADLGQGRSRGWFGVGVVAVDPKVLRQRNLPPGMLLTGAAPGGTGTPGDLENKLLVSVNGQQLDGTLASYCKAAGSVQSGATAQLGLIARPGGPVESVPVRFR